MKQKNRLLNYDLTIFQDDDYFKFSLDSLLLSNFVTLNYRTKNIVDLATGNAPIPMLLSKKTKAIIYGIEIQDCIYELGVESVKYNELDDRIKLILGDVRKIGKYFSSDSFDVVLCNPPYFSYNGDKSIINDNDVKSIARHEISLNINDVLKSAMYLLKNGGNFAMVHRSERFIEIISLMRKMGLEPKKVQFIYSKKGKNSDLFLIEGTKNGKTGLKVLPGLVVYDDNNNYNLSIQKMFGE